MTATNERVPTLPVPLPSDADPGIYVHVPFCRRICPYCDFNTYAGQESVIPAYVDALVEEMRFVADLRDRSSALHEDQLILAPTLFFGGGTPSLLMPEQVARIVETARERFGLAEDAEITLEANPESLDPAYLAGLRGAGVNRLSIGVQSHQRAGLRVLGRGHSPQRADEAFAAARDAGFDNISLDLIFGWPGQTLEDWESDLRMILDWNPEHVSLYSLIVEPGTPMHMAVSRGILSPSDDDLVADFYERAVECFSASGWEHYEISNWAREPHLRSRHNQLYWQNGSYLGFGAGAHGTIGDVRSSNILLPAKYIAGVRSGTLPRAVTEQLSPETQIGETMMLGLRLLVDGVSAPAVMARHGIDLERQYADTIDHFSEMGLLEWVGDRLRLTSRGVLLANDVCAAFLT